MSARNEIIGKTTSHFWGSIFRVGSRCELLFVKGTILEDCPYYHCLQTQDSWYFTNVYIFISQRHFFFHSNKHTIKKNFEFNKQLQYTSQFFTEWCKKWCVRIYYLYRNQLIMYEYELILASKRKKNMFTVEFDWRIY